MIPSRIYLIGMMGAGKTTIGQLLAKHLEYCFIDLDEIIEDSEKMSIQEIFRIKGEEYFRQIEASVLKNTGLNRNIVVSTGGGIIKNQENLRFLSEQLCVYLEASIDTLVDRLQNDTQRPLLQGEDLHKKLEQLFAERKEKYTEVADIVINIDNKIKSGVVQEINKKLRGVV